MKISQTLQAVFLRPTLLESVEETFLLRFVSIRRGSRARRHRVGIRKHPIAAVEFLQLRGPLSISDCLVDTYLLDLLLLIVQQLGRLRSASPDGIKPFLSDLDFRSGLVVRGLRLERGFLRLLFLADGFLVRFEGGDFVLA